ncbi:MAG: hypothetical protein KME06_13035 [Kastovskya adunca ATA6-11-RM4]|nr:hypothetical protein [Kastovskya adunca ATA6-11-RM4]
MNHQNQLRHQRMTPQLPTLHRQEQWQQIAQHPHDLEEFLDYFQMPQLVLGSLGKG